MNLDQRRLIHRTTKKIFGFGATDISAKIYYAHVADSENQIDFTPLALVFEMWIETEN